MNRQLADAAYGTHMAPLLTAVMATRGPIFEMGCGDYSTPLLHAICKAQERFLLSSDTSRDWISLFLDMESHLHTFKYVKVYENDWDTSPNPSKWDELGNEVDNWGVVFIDHRPGERRAIDIARLANKADIIVVHDTETASYNYEAVLNKFKYRYDYKRYNVYTTLVSNSVDVNKLF